MAGSGEENIMAEASPSQTRQVSLMEISVLYSVPSTHMAYNTVRTPHLLSKIPKGKKYPKFKGHFLKSLLKSFGVP